MSDDDYQMSAYLGENIIVCGIAPRNRLTTLDGKPCWNCNEVAVVRRYSGSGWYEDDFLCSACGEDVSSGYRPFQRGWRKKNIERALGWLADAIPYEDFRKKVNSLVDGEMSQGTEKPRPE
jgi:hypothetical protein